MRDAGEGRWFRSEELHPKSHKYSFVLEKKDGGFEWIADPHVAERDDENHSILRLESASAPPEKPPTVFSSFLNDIPPAAPGLVLRAEKVWVRLSEPNAIRLGEVPEGSTVELAIRTPPGKTVHQSTHQTTAGENKIPVPPLEAEGGFLAEMVLKNPDGTSQNGSLVLTSVQNVADDLRYGFYASYGSAEGDYAAKADMLAGLHVTAMEFYDYFPSHGICAPTEETYTFEPFDIPINGLNIKRKIEAGHERNILAVAYVAAYAASESVYRKHPHPMTDAAGSPKIFSYGEVLTEAEANRLGKPK